MAGLVDRPLVGFRDLQQTKSLSAEQAEALRPFLARDRRLHELVHELEAASIELIEQAKGITLGRQTALGNRRP